VSHAPYSVTASTEQFRGNVFSVRTDTVRMPDGSTTKRDYLRHTGAAAVVAIDDDGDVVLVRQYRHPVADVLWELPAGVLDVDGEDHRAAAGRELAEETGLVAGHIEPLIDFYPTPGYSDERIRIFLARDLAGVGPDFAYERSFEESAMTVHRFPMEQAMSMVDNGEIVNGVCALGLLAAWRRLRISG
jgi:ADP-ribose pyrophosphatase